MSKGPRRSVLLSAFTLGAALWLGACATTQQSPIPQTGGPQTSQKPVNTPKEIKKDDAEAAKEEAKADDVDKAISVREGLTPPHLRGQQVSRLALILPFTAKSRRLREEASAMMKAAEMAVFDHSEAEIVLIPLDSGGTSAGAKAAAQQAVKSGADIMLGPLLGGSVRSAGAIARASKTPVIAFSTDQSVAGRGVYLLSFSPEAEIERITNFAASQGATQFASLGPDSAYGRRANAAYKQSVAAFGGEVTATASYRGNDINVMQGPARELVGKYDKSIARSDDATPLFDAILLPESGAALRSIAPLLTYYSSEMANVQKLGTGLWNREETSLEPALRGGVFAGPDKAARAEFEEGFKLTYNMGATRLASLVYDAVNIGASVTSGDPKSRIRRITDPRGFYGVDGFVRFKADGTPQRGLAIYEVQAGRFGVLEPAPKTADEMSASN